MYLFSKLLGHPACSLEYLESEQKLCNFKKATKNVFFSSPSNADFIRNKLTKYLSRHLIYHPPTNIDIHRHLKDHSPLLVYLVIEWLLHSFVLICDERCVSIHLRLDLCWLFQHFKRLSGRIWVCHLYIVLITSFLYVCTYDNVTQCAERIFNKIAKAINKTSAGWKYMPQGLRVYFVWNPRIKGIESTH